jgi:cobyrinic acid a,c-diamide synthase
MQLLVQQLGPQVQQNPDFMQFQQKVQSIQVVMEARKAQLIAEFMQDYAKAEKEVLNQVENDPVLKLKDRDLDLKAREEQRKEEESQQKANLDMMRLMQNKEIAEEKLEQDDKHAKLRASVSLAKQGINEMQAIVKETN